MFCANCGKEVPDGIRFCPYCGETIVTLSEEDKKEHIESVPEENKIVVKEDDTDIESIQPTLLYGEYTESDKKSIRTAVLMMVIGLIGAVLCFGIVLYKNPNGNASIALRKLIGMEQKIGVAKTGKGIEDQLTVLVKKYTDSLYMGDLDSFKQVATPISEDEEIYCKCHGEFFNGSENRTYYYTRGVNKGDFVVYYQIDLLKSPLTVSYPVSDVIYVETDEDGNMYVNELYSYYNRTAQIIKDGWDTKKYDALVEYSNSEDILELIEMFNADREGAMNNEETVELLDNLNRRFQEMSNE